MVVNSKKTRTFVIENKGDKFEFKYTISKLIKEAPAAVAKTRSAQKVARIWETIS